MCNNTDILNTIAARIDDIVRNIGTEPCERCSRVFVHEYYKGKCVGYSWQISYSGSSIRGESGSWYFGLFHHLREIWYIHSDGTVADILLKAYEALASGKWKERSKEIEDKAENE